MLSYSMAVSQHAALIEESPQRPREILQPARQAQRVGGMVRHDVDAIAAVFSGGLEQLFVSPLQVQQHRFRMLAGAQAVDAKVDTTARELPFANAPDLDAVGKPASGADVEVGKNRMLRIEIADSEMLGSGAQPTALDFIFVGCAPVVDGRDLGGRRFAFDRCHAGLKDKEFELICRPNQKVSPAALLQRNISWFIVCYRYK
ncbi:MAG: hypothetical protein ACHBNF_01390 [Chromatiales bacterium]